VCNVLILKKSVYFRAKPLFLSNVTVFVKPQMSLELISLTVAIGSSFEVFKVWIPLPLQKLIAEYSKELLLRWVTGAAYIHDTKCIMPEQMYGNLMLAPKMHELPSRWQIRVFGSAYVEIPFRSQTGSLMFSAFSTGWVGTTSNKETIIVFTSKHDDTGKLQKINIKEKDGVFRSDITHGRWDLPFGVMVESRGDNVSVVLEDLTLSN
jgi:hypothetical protein